MASGAKGGPWRILFGLTFFVFGPCLLIVALVSAYRTHVFLRTSETAQATIVEMKEFHNMNKTSWSYAPVFTFTADGRPYTVASSLASVRRPTIRKGILGRRGSTLLPSSG